MDNVEMRGRIANVLEEMLNWHYTPEESGRDFDARVANAFGREFGVTIRKGSPDKEELFEGMHVYLEPYGSQRTPDVAIFYLDSTLTPENKSTWLPDSTINIEVKRCQTGKAVWNSGFPKQNYIYILNTKYGELEGTTFVLGGDLVTEDDEAKVESFKERLKSLKTAFGDFGNFKLTHLRPMFDESNDTAYWLTHIERNNREQRVLRFLRE